MSSVYTNIARKRIEQSQEASQNPSKEHIPQAVVTPKSNTQLSNKDESLPSESKKPTKPQNRLSTNHSSTPVVAENVEKYTTHIFPSLVKKVKLHALEQDINDYDVVNNALTFYFDKNK
jgi:hypothetical protein